MPKGIDEEAKARVVRACGDHLGGHRACGHSIGVGEEPFPVNRSTIYRAVARAGGRSASVRAASRRAS